MNEALNRIFDNQPKLLSPARVEHLYSVPRATIYDWKHRPEKHRVPENMFVKRKGGKIAIVTEVFKEWFLSEQIQEIE